MLTREQQQVLNQKPSAYRSMRMKELGLSKPTNKDNKGNLRRWILEEWLNLNALKDLNIELPCGKKYEGQTTPTVCRPKKKINKKTASPLAYDLSKKQIEKAIKIKEKGKRVDWSAL